MLPHPVSQPRRIFLRRSRDSERKLIDSLRSQARITNLGLFLLVALALTSLFGNLLFLMSTVDPFERPRSITSTLNNHGVPSLSRLIIVPGHAIYNGASAEDRLDVSLWTLEPYQESITLLEALYQHIAQAVELSLQDRDSLLVFSGGQTRPGTTTTEAESYLRLALQSKLLPQNNFARVTTENYALDSYQNVLFSIARFREYTGRYPEHITIVGFEMKRRRFVDLHRLALQWPEHKFEYIGIDDSDSDGNALAREGETLNGFRPFSRDLYGCHELLKKRKRRNLYQRYHPYHVSSPELRALMEWCPSDSDALFQGILPWN